MDSKHPKPHILPPNHALQRTEAGGGVFRVGFVLCRQPLSLSLSSLGPCAPFSVGGGTSVPVRFVGHVSSRSFRGRGLLPGVVARFGQPFPAAAPVIPPPVPRRSFRRQTPSSTCLTTRSSERRGASVPSSLPFLPPSLSLSSLGARSLCSVGEWHAGSRFLWWPRRFSFASSSRFAFGCVTSFGQPLPAAAPVLPPPVGCVFSFPRLRSHAPNKALQRTAGGVWL